MSFQNGQIIIDLTGNLVSTLIFVGFAALGWVRGFRWIVTIAGGVTLGYLLTVQGGGVIVGLVNAIYDFFFRFVNFISPNIAALIPPGPIIAGGAQAPLLLRVIIFIVFLILGISYTGPWQTPTLKGWSGGNQTLRLLGLATGIYTALLLISAAATFWQQGQGFVNLPAPVVTILNGFSTYELTARVFLVAFLGLLGIIFLLRFNRVVLPDPARK